MNWNASCVAEFDRKVVEQMPEKEKGSNMDVKIIILTALIGVIAAFSHVGQTVVQRKRANRDDQPVLPI